MAHVNKSTVCVPGVQNIFLNYVYTFLDENTYDDIKKSDFLRREFGHGEEKTHSGSNESSWTGFFLVGEKTYIELFREKYRKDLHAIGAGDNGVALSVDRGQDLKNITEYLKEKLDGNIDRGLFEKNIDGTLVPWLHYVAPENKTSMLPELDVWVTAYDKDYGALKNLEIDKHTGVTREVYNRTANAVPFDKSKLFKDIEEVMLVLNADVINKFVKLFSLLGYTCEENEEIVVLRGPGITFILKQADDKACKITHLRMSLNRPVNAIQTHTFGNSTLTLENKTAVWLLK